MRVLSIIIISCLIYLQGIKPVIADYYLLQYKKGDKDAIVQAAKWNPTSSLIQMEQGDIWRVIYTHNGDLTEYSLWYIAGVQALQRGDITGKVYLHRSLWLYPQFIPASNVMAQILEQQKNQAFKK